MDGPFFQSVSVALHLQTNQAKCPPCVIVWKQNFCYSRQILNDYKSHIDITSTQLFGVYHKAMKPETENFQLTNFKKCWFCNNYIMLNVSVFH